VGAVSVGVFGGAFDPPHVGHVELASRGIDHFGLDRLLVRVVEHPGHKDVDTAPQIRLFLAELAFAPLEEAEVSLDPFARTVDSLEALGLDDPLFLVGADEFASFLSWKEPARVLELARLGVATRPGWPGGSGRVAAVGGPSACVLRDQPLPVSGHPARALPPGRSTARAGVEAEVAPRLYRPLTVEAGMLGPIEGTSPT
jgi:nicotinate-nucleotide adenylyltransferase